MVANVPTFTCVVNVVAEDASGLADCATGTSQLRLPLRSDVFLYSDLLDGTSPDRPYVRGLQPCPICTRICSTLECINAEATPCTPATELTDCGAPERCALTRPCTSDADCAGDGSCGSAAQCLGGPNTGAPCGSASSAVGARCDGGTAVGTECSTDADCPGVGAICSYPLPTSQDCPPPTAPGQPIGRLPIDFELTTDSVTRTATGDDVGKRTFCGFCRDDDESGVFGVCLADSQAAVVGRPCAGHGDCTVCVGGAADAQNCSVPIYLEACLAGGGTCDPGTCGDTMPCASDADCAQPRERCIQRNNGAFGPPTGGSAKTITMMGAAAGPLGDGQPHAATLAGIFCVPPVLDPSIDNAGDLPGPGAVALPGQAQLLP